MYSGCFISAQIVRTSFIWSVMIIAIVIGNSIGQWIDTVLVKKSEWLFYSYAMFKYFQGFLNNQPIRVQTVRWEHGILTAAFSTWTILSATLFHSATSYLYSTLCVHWASAGLNCDILWWRQCCTGTTFQLTLFSSLNHWLLCDLIAVSKDLKQDFSYGY